MNMNVIYKVEAIGALCGCVVAQHFAIEKPLFRNRKSVLEACRQDLKDSARFDDVWAVHLYFSPRLTFYRYFRPRKFSRILHRVKRW